MSCWNWWLIGCLLIFFSPAIASPRPAQEKVREIESRALSLERSGDARGALSLWEKAATLNPKSASIQDHVGFLLAVLNRREEAVAHFLHALELDQHFAPAHYHLGVAYLLQRDPSRGIPQLQAAVDSVPNNFEYRFYLGRALNDTAAHRRDVLPDW